MTKQNVDYSQGLIYKIVCCNPDIKDVYVGSTTNFTQRKATHKQLSRATKSTLYQTIRENGGWDNWQMVLIERFPCAGGLDLRARERHFFEELAANLNQNYPRRSPEEYENQEERKIAQKLYRETHKEKQKLYRTGKIKCVCGKHVQQRNLSKHQRTLLHQQSFDRQHNELMKNNELLNQSTTFDKELFFNLCNQIETLRA